jgi:hypothetical protein
MPTEKERQNMQSKVHTHHSNMTHGKAGTGNKVSTPKAGVGGRSDLTFKTSPSDSAKVAANGGKVFSQGGVNKGTGRDTKFYIGPKYTSTDSTRAAGTTVAPYSKE